MKRRLLILLILGTPLIFSLCKKDDPVAPVIPTVNTPEFDDTPYQMNYGAFPTPNFNGNNPTVQGVKLGRMLFYETRLSKDNSISCASCHVQDFGFSDPDRLSSGVDGSLGKRQAMPTFNLAWHTNEFFWDGRAHLLRDQALMPIEDPLEMKETLENVVAKLSSDTLYTHQFIRAFDADISSEGISLALEQFMNTIISNQSKYDKFLAGELSLTDGEERGRILFFTEYNPGFPDESGADCAHCHGGFNFDNNLYMNNGLDEESDQDDIGRKDVSGLDRDMASFKVPSLRNAELTAPYMHDGRFNTLEEVINHYNDGIKVSPSLDPALLYTTQTGLMLSEQDKQDLIAFLKTLTDEGLSENQAFSDPFD